MVDNNSVDLHTALWKEYDTERTKTPGSYVHWLESELVKTRKNTDDWIFCTLMLWCCVILVAFAFAIRT